MLEGIFLTILLGMILVGMGIIQSRVARAGLSIIPIYAVGSGLTVLLLGIFFVRWAFVWKGVDGFLPLLWIMVLSGISNTLGHISMVATMRRGHRAASWAIGQSAMTIPFLVSVFYWGDSMGLDGVLGLLCMLVAIALLARSSEHGRDEKIRLSWLGLALLTPLLYGVGQMLVQIPTHWEGWSDVARIRPLLSVLCAGVAQLVLMVARRERFLPSTFSLSLGYAVLMIFAVPLVFLCSDMLGRVQLSGIVWPVAVGTCVLGFSVYTHLHLHEKFTKRDIAGIALNILGIVLMA